MRGAAQARVRPAGPADAALVYRLYTATPAYFEIISIPVPTPAEVETELRTAERDPMRRTELLLDPDLVVDAGLAHPPPRDPESGAAAVGYLDYKLHYPERGDATVNLLLVHGELQSRGYGRRAVSALEGRLRGDCERVLASIYGSNPRAERFWSSLGYSFAIDAKPVLDWYAKTLTSSGAAADPHSGR